VRTVNGSGLVCAVVCLLAAVGGASAVAAHAAPKAYKTKTSAKRTASGIEGRISSAKKGCLGHRLVRAQLFTPASPPIPLGNTLTTGSGRWSYPFETEELPPGSRVEVLVEVKKLSPKATCAGLRARRVI
jgi:hypothetical protein